MTPADIADIAVEIETLANINRQEHSKAHAKQVRKIVSLIEDCGALLGSTSLTESLATYHSLCTTTDPFNRGGMLAARKAVELVASLLACPTNTISPIERGRWAWVPASKFDQSSHDGVDIFTGDHYWMYVVLFTENDPFVPTTEKVNSKGYQHFLRQQQVKKGY